ncbi:hypothetical protein VN97_g592 [Penicillium thymicola]|uniref:Uncharacterized protein n=1 Tax=Penicillium thymicola TaxID=293382 RepID=A0AAI9TT98_PENTH|nr:hypothetical protein VN97_g592 [Penicillium thymicola]
MKQPKTILHAPPRIPPARDHGTEAFNLNLDFANTLSLRDYSCVSAGVSSKAKRSHHELAGVFFPASPASSTDN